MVEIRTRSDVILDTKVAGASSVSLKVSIKLIDTHHCVCKAYRQSFFCVFFILTQTAPVFFLTRREICVFFAYKQRMFSYWHSFLLFVRNESLSVRLYKK